MAHFDAQQNQAAGRAQGYWLLSRLFLEVPTKAMLTDLHRLLDTAAEGMVSNPLAVLRSAVDEALADPTAAAVAYTQHLVLGNRQAGEPLPFESHVREGRLPGENTQLVAAAMTAAGYGDVAPEAPSPDHLGAELRFMSLLCHREHVAWLDGNRDAAMEALAQQQEFLVAHLAQWGPGYCRGLAARTADRYLHAVTALAASTVEEDAATLDEICTWLAPASAPACATPLPLHP